jgi:tRNA-Thr(GGU) m(6)t(6)A37 methyltransferase TsaA
MPEKVVYHPIGVIHTPFKTLEAIPRGPRSGRDVEGMVVLRPELADGLADLDGFSHVYLIFHLHRSKGYSLKVVPPHDKEERGLFATHSPRRPNPIGISLVRVERVEDGRLYFRGVDMLDGTPLLDIKPFVQGPGPAEDMHTGWLEGKLPEEGPEGPGSRSSR